MGDQNSFQERLKRLEEKNVSSGKPAPQSTPAKARGNGNSMFIPALAVGLVVIGVLSYGALSIVGEFGKPFDGVTSVQSAALEKQNEMLAILSGDPTGEKKAEPSGDPTTYDRQQELMGYSYGTAYAASQDGTAVPIDQIFTDYAPVSSNSPEQTIAVLEPNEECSLRPVQDGEKLVNVNIASMHEAAPITFTAQAEIEKALTKATSEAFEKGASLSKYPANTNQVGVINVLVTDTSQPLYLALQSLSTNVFWSIQTAPGVEIAHVALVSTGAAGFVGDIGNATVEHVGDRDYGTDFSDPYGFSLAPEDMRCMIRPFRQPNETWQAWAGSEAGNTINGNLLYSRDKGFEAYKYWFNQQTGAEPNSNFIGAYAASHVLVGPVPSEPVTAKQGTTWYFSPKEILITGDSASRADQYREKLATLANTAAVDDPFSTVLPETLIAELPAGTELSTVSGKLPSLFGTALVHDTVPQMLTLEKINNARVVNFDEKILISDLLQPGEDVPEKDLFSLYGMMRGPEQFAGRCGTVLADIATRCALVRGTARRSGPDAVTFSMTYGYIPSYELGHFERSTKNDFKSYTRSFESEGRDYLQAEKQIAVVKAAKETCSEIRAQFGNCVITKVHFGPWDDGSRALIRLDVHGSDNKFDIRNVEKVVEELFDKIVL